VLAVATLKAGRRAAAGALVLALCLGPTGCSLFKKRPDANAAPAGGGAGLPPPRFPTAGDPLTGPSPGPAPTNQPTSNNNLNTTAAATSVPGAILAGRVIDGFSRPPANTSIRWVSLDDKAATEQEVSVTPEGYFTIQGLKPGAHYKLVARGKQGERLVAGVSYTNAPNIRVLIQVKEEFAGSPTPDVPAHAGAANMNNPPAASQNTPPPGWNGAPNAFPGNDNEPALPTSINVAPSAPSSAIQPSKDWMPGPALANQNTTWPPVLEIPRARPTPPAPALQIPNVSIPNPPIAPKLQDKPSPAFPGGGPDIFGRARIPSCVREGNKIVNFALNDINGEPWELKRHRKGKLVLIDFWGTWCHHCLESAPFLNKLQAKYGAQGLEVVGIAYEQGGTPLEQAYAVGEMCKRLRINYRQLLGAGNDCPVRREFRLQYYPSMFLLDENGFIVWDVVGAPRHDQRDELERAIQLRLNPRLQ
jgi:thiol-disulfide isomerase/thioredoxin